jgi:beta-glucosidase
LKAHGGVKPGEYADFLGLNYYTRATISGLADGTRAGVPVNDLGWEIYPEGIARCARIAHNILPRPIYITENGTCDNSDSFRCRFIYDHLKALSDSGLPIERYYHWCFTDNFEWCEGESARFGLVHVDYPTQKRTIKKSGIFFSDIIKHRGINDKMFNEYIKPQEYHV